MSLPLRRGLLVLAMAPLGCADFIQRNELASVPFDSTAYSFRREHFYAETLLNAFDYGHATIYEAFVEGRPQEEVEGPLFDFIMEVNDNGPRLQPSEEALAPRFTRGYWFVQNVFDWAHGLHRNINDILADERVEDKHAAIEAVTDVYLRQPQALHWRWKRMDILMDGQPYSGTFRQRYPKWNGIIWAYHWFQNGVYEPLVLGRTRSERAIGVDAAAALYQCSRLSPPTRFPRHMPMSWQVAPTFARMHPRAAAIFDNLHMLHDIVSDVLLSEKVQDKQAELRRMVALLQDDHSFIDESGNRGMGPTQGHPTPHGGAQAPEGAQEHGGMQHGGMQHDGGTQHGGTQHGGMQHGGMQHGGAPSGARGPGPGATCAEGLVNNPPAFVPVEE